MNSIFQIGSELTPARGSLLAIQAGKSHLSYSLTNRGGDELYKLHYFSVENWTKETLEKLLATLPEAETVYPTVEFAFETDEFTLFPVAGFQDDKLLATHYALHPYSDNSLFKKDSLAEWQLYVGYTIPSLLINALHNRYSELRTRHYIKLALQQAGQSDMQGNLIVEIRLNHIFILLLRNNRFLFAKEFFYETPTDVLYYLLKICEDQLLTTSEVEVELMGLIEKDSSLYKELSQYFTYLAFREATWKMAQNEFPAHYFTSLNYLAKCAL
ncbi:MAG: DUF3822 family protein [Chitinophagaceae bacterium]